MKSVRHLIQALRSVRTKIILPYLLLTLITAAVGAYVVTQLVASSLQERFDNQLLDAGRITAQGMVVAEEERLQLLRAISFTTGLVEAVQAADIPRTAALVEPLISNQPADLVVVLDSTGAPQYTWPTAVPPLNYQNEPDIQRVLRGESDVLGDKRALLIQVASIPYLVTAGPLTTADGQVVGAVLVGTSAENLARRLTESALARVSLYTPNGQVLATTLGLTSADRLLLAEPTLRYSDITALLREPDNRFEVVSRTAETEVPLRQIQILGQTYQMAFGEWRLRQQSFGLFSVALPSNFIVSAAATSRNSLGLLFSLATVAVLAMGLYIAQLILAPLERLVRVSTAVVGGDLDNRTGLVRADEIGKLALSFDTMTDHLVARNREMTQQASQLQAIINSIADGVLVFDHENKLIHANAAAQTVRHLTLRAIVGGDNADLPGDEAELAKLFTNTTAQAFRRYQVGGRVYSPSVAPVTDPAGKGIGRVVVLRDMTVESEAEHVKDTFIQNISHELRTPLTSVKGYLNLLLMTAADSLTAQQTNLVRVASTNADNLVEQVNKLIELSELQAGNLKLHLAPLNIEKLAEQTAERWRPLMAQRDVRFTLHCDEGTLWVNGDEARLSWVLDNLLDNASKYTAAGGEVILRLGRRGEQALLMVEDTGMGVRDVDLPYLFTPFFRATRDHHFDVRGMGLGLFIVQALVQGHGGQVWVESSPQVGSTFGVLLPLHQPQGNEANHGQLEPIRHATPA